MKNERIVNGQVKSLQHITRLGALFMMGSLAAYPAFAVSASKSVSVGNSVIGATASVSFNDLASADLYRATVTGRADGKVLSHTLGLASGTATLQIQKATNCHAYGSLKAAGITLTSWDTTFSGSKNFSTPKLTKTLVGGSTRIWLGPLPISLKLGVKAGIQAKGVVNSSPSPTTGLPVVQGSIGPVVDAAVTGSAGVDVLFAGVEVNGSLTLIGLGMTGDITYYTPHIGVNPTITYRATANVHSVDGAIKLCAWVDPPFVSRSEWCKTVYEYHGGQSSYVIASGTRRPLPVFNGNIDIIANAALRF